MAKGTAQQSGRTAIEDARAEATPQRRSDPKRKKPRSVAGEGDPETRAELPSAERASEMEEGLGYGRDDGPESQGAFAGTGYGDDRQGTYGDEDYDASYGATGGAGPEPVDPAERGADTPLQEPWDAISEASDDIVANEERDVATGDAALQPVKKRSRASTARPDDRIREEIEDLVLDVVDPTDVTVTVVEGTVVFEGVVDTDEERDAVEGCVDGVEGVRAIENRLEVREDPEA